MRTQYRQTEDRPLSVAMTPMIDVVFLLLIFFVCTASFQKVEKLLPSDMVLSGDGQVDAKVEPQPELEEVIVRGASDGQTTTWTINDAPVESLAQLPILLRGLAEIDPTLPVIVDADGPTPFGEVITAYDASRRAGFSTVRFAASAE